MSREVRAAKPPGPQSNAATMCSEERRQSAPSRCDSARPRSRRRLSASLSGFNRSPFSQVSSAPARSLSWNWYSPSARNASGVRSSKASAARACCRERSGWPSRAEASAIVPRSCASGPRTFASEVGSSWRRARTGVIWWAPPARARWPAVMVSSSSPGTAAGEWSRNSAWTRSTAVGYWLSRSIRASVSSSARTSGEIPPSFAASRSASAPPASGRARARGALASGWAAAASSSDRRLASASRAMLAANTSSSLSPASASAPRSTVETAAGGRAAAGRRNTTALTAPAISSTARRTSDQRIEEGTPVCQARRGVRTGSGRHTSRFRPGPRVRVRPGGRGRGAPGRGHGRRETCVMPRVRRRSPRCEGRAMGRPGEALLMEAIRRWGWWLAGGLLALGCSSSDNGGGTPDSGLPDAGLLHVASPTWEEQVVYFVMIDRFNDGEPSNDDQHQNEFDQTDGDKYSGGDLQGIIDKLDYIQGLGATAVWITPPVANMWWDPLQESGGYHGYWARHLKKVDEHVG